MVELEWCRWLFIEEGGGDVRLFMKFGWWEIVIVYIYGDYLMFDICVLKWFVFCFLYGWIVVLCVKFVIDMEMKFIVVDNCGVIYECLMDLDDSNDVCMVFVSVVYVE